jgi:hypothetical protein
MAALGEPVAPEDRRGLVLFLRRGMWGWVRALAASAQQPARSSPTRAATLAGHGAVVQVLATMVLAATGRTP